ncbi:MAG: hypothetical protein NC250_07995 [Alistipes senegalensis]|nr:hypothetical protein [Bacteroides cellulosilyticus]MCM1352657.1 hypothetical protein [Alistipes senegalensis]
MHRFIYYIGILLSAACTCRPTGSDLQTGDLLFQCGDGAMTEAITAATGDDRPLNYTHVGILLAAKRPAHREPMDGSYSLAPANSADSVLEATTEGGVRIVVLADFLDRAARIDGKSATVAMRLQDTTGVAASVARARKALGAPYDYSFRPDNGRYYCSELVCDHYLRPDGSHCFTARPMNFRAPDGSLPRYWAELFERLGEPVPEGVPGTNPNDMSQEEGLYEVYRWF